MICYRDHRSISWVFGDFFYRKLAYVLITSIYSIQDVGSTVYESRDPEHDLLWILTSFNNFFLPLLKLGNKKEEN